MESAHAGGTGLNCRKRAPTLKTRDFAYPPNDLRHYYIYINHVPEVIKYLTDTNGEKRLSEKGEDGRPKVKEAFPYSKVDEICRVDTIIIPFIMENLVELLDRPILEIKRCRVLHNFSKLNEHELDCYEGEEVHRIYVENHGAHEKHGDDLSHNRGSLGETKEDNTIKRVVEGDIDSSVYDKIQLIRNQLDIAILPSFSTVASTLNHLIEVGDIYGKIWAIIFKLHLSRSPEASEKDYVIPQGSTCTLDKEDEFNKYSLSPAVSSMSIVAEISDLGLIPLDFLSE